MTPDRVVVTGVTGSGKSTVGAALAERLGAPFLEGDDFHSPASVAKMASGVPLDDADRWPWLAGLRQAMRNEERVVVACSALKRPYRDALRRAGSVRFLHLLVDRAEVERRLHARGGHFMPAGLVESQFETLEPPAAGETDVAVIPADADQASVLAAAEAAVATLRAGTGAAPLLADGGDDRSIGPDELEAFVRAIAETEILSSGARRVLLVPPDHTRLHSRAGETAGILFETLTAAGCDVAVLPATGTHAAMTRDETELLFGGRVPFERILVHRLRDGLVRLGEIAADEVAALSSGRLATTIPVDVDGQLLAGWDLIVSIGQVVPHEVVGMANFTKNLVVGLGGAATIDRSHFLGAVCNLETIMGRIESPVRDAVDAAFDRYLAARVEVLWLLTVIEDAPDGIVHRGLFAGRGGSAESGGAAFRAAATLSARRNIEVVPEPLHRVACWLDPAEFRSTWLANKAVYRTRMALADDCELVVLAPGVVRFGEDAAVDVLIRRHGYRGAAAVLEAVEADPELAANLGAAAHLIHGSSEGRFRITYCTDPSRGGLSNGELERVGYGWRPLAPELALLCVDASTPTGPRLDRNGRQFMYLANPALGLWAAAPQPAKLGARLAAASARAHRGDPRVTK
ncbi:MAG: gluconokinase, GntK/IdnK-type [Verrucomicrobiota bacterium]